jgi:hypothetical protein
MAKDKNSFLLYTDVHHTVKKLTDNQAGQLFKHILSYVNDENPTTSDIIIEIAFEPIKQSLKRDLRKYEIIREKRSIAGKASADKRQQVLTSVEQDNHGEQVLTNSTVSVIVSDSVSGIVKKERRKKKDPVFVDENQSLYFYTEEVKKAKEYNDAMSQDYVSLCRHICRKENNEWVLPYVLRIPKQMSLNDFSKLYEKAGGNLESITTKIDSIQNKINYHDTYLNLYTTLNTWFNRDKK